MSFYVSYDAEVWAAASCMLTAILFQIHLMRRMFESIFVSKYRKGAKMHVLLYLMALAYYCAAPLTLLSPVGTDG